MNSQHRFFSKDRLYQAGLVALVLLALGLFAWKMMSESRLQKEQGRLQAQHASQAARLEASCGETIEAVTHDSLSVLATALTAIPMPGGNETATSYHAALDSLVRQERVKVALVIDPNNVVFASTNRYFEGKAVEKAVLANLSQNGEPGVVATEQDFVVSARLRTPIGTASTWRIVLRVTRAPNVAAPVAPTQ